MPQKQLKCSPDLGIRLNGCRMPVALGDTITGEVYRQRSLITTQAEITVSLRARAKSRVIRKTLIGLGKRTGETELLSGVETAAILHSGPLHIAAEQKDRTWPFSMTLPTCITPCPPRVPPRAGPSSADISAEQASSSGRPGPEVQSLPSSFFFEDYGYGHGMEAFVEYYIEANLTCGEGRARSTKHALFPVQIQRLCPANQGWATTKLLLHMNMLPRRENPKDRLVRIPVHAEVSDHVHLGNDTNIRLSFFATDPRNEDRAIEDNVERLLIFPENLVITRFTLWLVHCKTIRYNTVTGQEAKEVIAKEQISDMSQTDTMPREPLYVPWMGVNRVGDTGARSNEGHYALDIGDKLGIKVKDKMNAGFVTSELSESFTTDNISSSYKFEWRLTISGFGCEYECSGDAPFTMLPRLRRDAVNGYASIPPADDNIPPPAYHDPSNQSHA